MRVWVRVRSFCPMLTPLVSLLECGLAPRQISPLRRHSRTFCLYGGRPPPPPPPPAAADSPRRPQRGAWPRLEHSSRLWARLGTGWRGEMRHETGPWGDGGRVRAVGRGDMEEEGEEGEKGGKKPVQ